MIKMNFLFLIFICFIHTTLWQQNSEFSLSFHMLWNSPISQLINHQGFLRGEELGVEHLLRLLGSSGDIKVNYFVNMSTKHIGLQHKLCELVFVSVVNTCSILLSSVHCLLSGSEFTASLSWLPMSWQAVEGLQFGISSFLDRARQSCCVVYY